MKQKYTLTVANSQINIMTETPKDEIDAIVGIVDRRIREIHLHSKTCSRTDAAILLCLDYCAEKIELQKTIKSCNDQIEHLNNVNENAQKEIAFLQREIETLRASLDMRASHVFLKKEHGEQMTIDETEKDSFVEKKEKITRTALDTLLGGDDDDSTKDKVMVNPDADEKDKLHAKARKKKVRAMFDMISFDDI